MHVGLYHWQAVRSWFPSHFPLEISDPDGHDHQSPDLRSFCLFPDVRRGEYALIHPGSGSPAKNYQLRFYRDLADDLRHRGYPEVRFVLGPVEAEDGHMVRYLAEGTPGVKIEVPEDVEALARLQAGASLYIGNDSGASHLAGVLGTATIALYKITDPEVWGVMGRRVKNIRAGNEDSALRQIREYLGKKEKQQEIN
jgi:ADP-heptose:LPS heptosyltransferase